MSNIEFADLQSIRKLLRLEIEILKQLPGGNSEIYLVETEEKIVVAKKYKGDINRRIESMNREIKALNFLRMKNVFLVPELLDYSRDDFIVVMEYIEGVHPEPNSKCMNEIINFLKLLKVIYDEDASFSEAIDGIDTTSDLLNQIQRRLSSLEIQMKRNGLIIEAQKSFKELNALNFTTRISSKTYSVSDLGIHNMIQCGDIFRFLDLEFFGSDSPVKVIGDFLLHPRNTFPNDLKLELLTNLISFYKIPQTSIEEYLPLAALKWAVIVMRRLVGDKDPSKENAFCEAENLALNYISMSRCNGEELLLSTVY
jgi:hypothetical protein